MKCMADNILAMPSNLSILHIAQLETFDESTTVLNEVLGSDNACMNALREYEGNLSAYIMPVRALN
jgi:ATP-binding cassette subfamily F protein 3